MERPIYLDYNATTPVAAEVIDAMLPALRDAWGNPSSAHEYGRIARRTIDGARAQVAALIGCSPGEVIFTSGGTESDNAAIVGVAEALADRGSHLVISAIEHAAVDRACVYLEGRGWTVSRVAVDADGRVDPAAVAAACGPQTVLVSIMHSNNETGVLQPIEEIARTARARGIVVHSDTAQSVGKLPVDVDRLGVDLLTIAGHKLYAPKGVGALYLRGGTPFAAISHGAPHESGRRPGTENTPEIVGLGAACELAARELDERMRHLRAVRDRLESGLRTALPDLVVHGGRVERLPNTLSAAIPSVDGNALVSGLAGVATAAGAACHAGKPEPSRVLRAMGVPDELSVCTLRLTAGRDTTEEQVDLAVDEIVSVARTLR